jgi:hypothetical protein
VDRLENRGGNHGDEYDRKNLTMSAKYMLGSVDSDMLKMLHSELRVRATGPEVFAAIVNFHQSLNLSAVRTLTEQLQKLKLKDEPAENVETFSQKIVSLAKRIQGAGPDSCPQDLHILVYDCYKGSTTGEFYQLVNGFGIEASKGRGLDWMASIIEMKETYRKLVTRGQWEAAKHHKEKAEAQGLSAAITKLQKTVDGMSGKSGKNSSGKSGASSSGGSDTRECYHCGKKGHIKPNCPDKGKPKAAKAGSGTGSSGATKSATGIKTAPKDGQPNTKTIDGVVAKWCGTCKRWTKGDKAHLTEEHVKKVIPVTAAASASLASAVASNAPLRYFGGYVGAVQEKNLDDCSVDSGDQFLIDTLIRSQASTRMTRNYLATMGMTKSGQANIHYCQSCDLVCDDGTLHVQTHKHVHSKVLETAGYWVCQCDKTSEQVAEWIEVKKKGVKRVQSRIGDSIAALKDSAGRR